MALLRFFKTPKHQRYEYKPRYWDPEKEEREKRKKFLEGINDEGSEATKARIKAGFRRKGLGVDNKVYRRQQMQKSNIILIIIIFVLLFITYVFLKVYLPEIVSAVEGMDK